MEKLIKQIEKNRFLFTLFTGVIILVIFMTVPNFVNLTPTDKATLPDQQDIENIDYENYFNYLINPEGKGLKELKVEDATERPDEFLRTCSTDIDKGVWLESDDGSVQITNRQKLNEFLGELNTPEEAVAYIYATNCNFLKEFENDNQVVRKIKDGYQVEIFYYPEFISGCGYKTHHKVLYELTSKGTLNIIEDTILDEPEYNCVKEEDK